jgi:hypothetical protein
MNLFTNTYLILISLPALLLSLTGFWVVFARSKLEQTRRWVLFLLAAGVLFALPLAALAPRFRTGPEGLVLILEIPALIGVLALLLINGRAVFARWREERVLVSALLLALVGLLVSMARGDPPFLPLIQLLPALILAGVWFAGQHLGRGGLVYVSLMMLLLLILDAVGMTVPHVVLATPWMWGGYKLASVLFGLLALVLVALLVDRGLRSRQAGYHRSYLAHMILALLLILSLAAGVLRHGLLTNATARAAEDHMPIGVAAVGVIVGLLLTFGLGERRRRAGLAFTVLMPILVAVAYTGGWLFDPHEITASRGEQINQAVLSYYRDRNAYPDRLSDLTPAYLPFILGPLTGRGQIWCYEGGESYYRLGYVIFLRYYEPTLPTPYYEIKMVGTAGRPPGGSWMCDQELELMKATGGL